MSRRRRLLQDATDSTLLRYGPEERGLARLLRESRANFKLGIKAENATAAGVKAVAKHARPLIRKTYAAAGSTFDQADQDLKTLAGPSSDAAVREAAGARRRLAEAAADADTELVQRGVDAESGRAYGVRQRRQEYQGERGKIREEQQALGREEGLYASTTFRQLSAAEAKLALDKRRVKISAGNLRARRQHDAATEQQARETLGETRRHHRQLESKDGKGKPKWTPLQRRGAQEDWAKGWAILQSDKPKTKDYAAYMKYLGEKGIPLPIARGLWQKYQLGGVNRPLRRKLKRNYGLKPKPPRWESKPGDRIPPVVEPLLPEPR